MSEKLNNIFIGLNLTLNKNINNNPYPGHIYLQPTILRSDLSNLKKLENNTDLDELKCNKCLDLLLNKPKAGTIKDLTVSQDSLKLLVGQIVIGYSLCSRATDSSAFKYLIDEILLDIYKEHGIENINDYNIVGEYLLKFLPDAADSLVRDAEIYAGYKIVYASKCAFVPKVINTLNLSNDEILEYKQKYKLVLK